VSLHTATSRSAEKGLVSMEVWAGNSRANGFPEGTQRGCSGEFQNDRLA
jgi:hypothetical protein